MLLVISNSGDMHSDMLVRAARDARVSVFRLNTDHFRHDGQLSVALLKSGRASGVLVFGDRRLNLSEVRQVVIRRPQPSRWPGQYEAWEARLLNNEWSALDDTLSQLEDCLVLNPLAGSSLARHKLIQLQHASRAGLDVPETIVSNDRNALTEFAQRHPCCITKGVSASHVREGSVVLSGPSRIVRAIPEDADFACPVLLQQRVTPAAMWRVVVVCDKVLAVRFTHPELSSIDDSRLINEKLVGEFATLPGEMGQRMRALLHSLGVHFCSADLVEDARGQLWFLDLNPDGQWAWLETQYGVPVSNTIVRAYQGRQTIP